MFHSARIRLTAWYLLIIMCISLLFSGFIYQVLNIELNHFNQVQRQRFERRFLQTEIGLLPPPGLESDIANEIRIRLVTTLATVNLAILIISGGLGYLLAGRTLKPIQAMVDEQNRFIGDSSHEFRTPLASLKTAFEVSLRDKNLTLKESRALITDSLEDINKLQSLSDSLLKLAQFQKPDLSIKLISVSAIDVIRQAIKRVEPLARIKNITIKNEVDKTLQLKGDSNSLTDLFVILFDNAIKYSRPKSTVTLTSKHLDGYGSLTVSDQGDGIPKADLPHIFDRFYRADFARSKTSSGGYGLGLSIAKRIANLHQGQISVTSQPGHGSQFTLKLPIYS